MRYAKTLARPPEYGAHTMVRTRGARGRDGRLDREQTRVTWRRSGPTADQPERICRLLRSASRRSEVPEPLRVDAVLLHFEVQGLVLGPEEPRRLAPVPVSGLDGAVDRRALGVRAGRLGDPLERDSPGERSPRGSSCRSAVAGDASSGRTERCSARASAARSIARGRATHATVRP